MLNDYKNTDFIHIRSTELENVSSNFVPVLFKIELHLQQFNSGQLKIVYKTIQIIKRTVIVTGLN